MLYLVDISYTYTGTIGVLLTIILSSLVSLITGNIEIIHIYIINELKTYLCKQGYRLRRKLILNW